MQRARFVAVVVALFGLLLPLAPARATQGDTALVVAVSDLEMSFSRYQGTLYWSLEGPGIGPMPACSAHGVVDGSPLSTLDASNPLASQFGCLVDVAGTAVHTPTYQTLDSYLWAWCWPSGGSDHDWYAGEDVIRLELDGSDLMLDVAIEWHTLGAGLGGDQGVVPVTGSAVVGNEELPLAGTLTVEDYTSACYAGNGEGSVRIDGELHIG